MLMLLLLLLLLLLLPYCCYVSALTNCVRNTVQHKRGGAFSFSELMRFAAAASAAATSRVAGASVVKCRRRRAKGRSGRDRRRRLLLPRRSTAAAVSCQQRSVATSVVSRSTVGVDAGGRCRGALSAAASSGRAGDTGVGRRR